MRLPAQTIRFPLLFFFLLSFSAPLLHGQIATNEESAKKRYEDAYQAAISYRFDKAIDLLQEAIPYYQQQQNWAQYFLGWEYLGECHWNKNDFSKAMAICDQVEDSAVSLLGPRHVVVAKLYNLRGIVFGGLSRMEDQIIWLHKALDLLPVGQDTSKLYLESRIEILNNLGVSYGDIAMS
ncbi:MAG: hypothetical protein AAF206_27400, partial [Bacteroidota bacterium]